ncbi:hypothetical protein D3C80_1432230 [compost metagenome]
MRQAIKRPDKRRQQHDQDPGGVIGQRSQQFAQALIEKQRKTEQQHAQTNALAETETLTEDKQTADQQQDWRDLNHQLRGAGAEQVQAGQIEHIVGT